MRGSLLPWIISFLLVGYMAISTLFGSDSDSGLSGPLTAESVSRRLASLQSSGTTNSIPVMAITTAHRPSLLLRLLKSIDVQVKQFIILQAGKDPEITRVVAEMSGARVTVKHITFSTPVGPSEMWNEALKARDDAESWVFVDERVEFESGALSRLINTMTAQSQMLAGNSTNHVILAPGRLTAASRLWECFVLFHQAVDEIGRFDPNFYPASQEGYDYLVRLSRKGLWLQEMPDVHLKDHPEEASWAPSTPELQEHLRRAEHGRPYFALKWGHSDTAGVYDADGHWDQKCLSNKCQPAPPVLFGHPFNDPTVPLSYAPFDPMLRDCIVGSTRNPCRFKRDLVKHPKLLPQGEFDGRKYVEQEDATPEREYKNFVYLIQASKKHTMDPPLHESSDRDIIWLTYGDKSGDLYVPKSSWTTGRNQLLDFAITRAAEMPNGGYLYYIFMDGDVIVRSRSDKRLLYREDLPPDPYDRFEVFLKDWEPSVGTVAYWWTLYDPTKLSIHHNNDAVFSAHHRETLSFGLPYVDSLDCESWYYSQHIMNSVNAMLYNTRRVQFNGMEARNEEHIALYKRKMVWKDPRCFAITAALPTSPLRRALVVEPNPTYTPGQPTKRGQVSYVVPLDFIYRHFNISHPIVQRALKFRQRPLVQQILNASMKVSPGQYVQDSRECELKGADDHRCFDEQCPEPRECPRG